MTSALTSCLDSCGDAAPQEPAAPPLGKRSVRLFADASVDNRFSLGSWAFCVPELSIEGGGCSPGTDVPYFELKAVVEGLHAIAGCDATEVRIVTDCKHTARCLRSVDATRPGLTTDPTGDNAAVQAAVLALGSEVKICVARPKSGSIEHRACHKAARRYIREVVRSPQCYATYRVIELRQRVDHISREREDLRSRIAKLDRRIAAAEAELDSYTLVEGNVEPSDACSVQL